MNTPYVCEDIPFPAVEGNPRNGEGAVILLADGRLLMVYGEFSGTKDASPATLQGALSSDRGRTWQGKHTVQENIGGKNVMSASLLRAADGDLLLGFLRKDELRSRCTPFFRRSSDEGRSWSEPAPVVPVSDLYHVVNNDRLVRLDGGRILMPAAVMDNGVTVGDRVFFSDDGGRSWKPPALQTFLPQSKVGAQEPGVVELKDGRVMMWCRSDLKEIYRCDSRDGGETYGPWTSTGLKAPCSPASIKRVPSSGPFGHAQGRPEATRTGGDLLCIFNNHGAPRDPADQDRSPLTAAISTDEAATWRIVADLEPDRTKAACYTSITFLPEGEILLTYYRGRDVEPVQGSEPLRRHQVLAHLKVAVLNETWLRGGPMP